MNKQSAMTAYFRCLTKRGHHALFRRGFLSPSLARMRLPMPTSALVVISFSFLFVAQPAYAATWPVPTSGLSATLGFHQTYTAGAKSYVHSGIDIPASAGMQISSPLAGTVRFTGTVPSGDSRTGGASSQETMNAVSIEVQGGRVITLMPFANIEVKEGQALPEGALLGTLAPSGDVSTGATHLHLGYKDGGTYLDPMQLFGSASGGAFETEAEVMPAAPEEGVANASAAGVEAGSSSAMAAGSCVEPASSSDAFGVIETGAYEQKGRSVHEETLLSPIEQAFLNLGAACHIQLAGLADAFLTFSKDAGIALSAFVANPWIPLLVVLTLLLIACRRFLTPFIRNMRKTGECHLFQLSGGDSIYKLFPASGAAFMSRSRIARGR